MGVKCKVIYNRLGGIDVVQAPNDEPSKLYNDLLDYTKDEKKALDLWTIPYTIGFQNVNGEWSKGDTTLNLDINQEPQMKDVLNYVKQLKNEDSILSQKELFEIANNLYSLPINSIEELYTEIRNTFYPNGIFEFNRDSLNNSILYNDLEVLDILSNPNLQQNVKDLVEKIEVQYIKDSSQSIDKLIETTFFEEENLLVDRTVNIGIGKHYTMNPYTISKELSKYLAGIKNRDEFDAVVKQIPFEAIVNNYQNNSDFANNLFKTYSELKKIPIYEEIDGELQKKPVSNYSTRLKEVLLSDLDASLLRDNLILLAQLDVQMWEGSTEQIKPVLKEIEFTLANFNIDVVGLSESIEYKSQDEVLELINELDIFVEALNNNLVDETTLDNLSNKISSYFELQVEPDNSYSRVENDSQTLIKLNPISDEITLFENNSVIKTKDGFYHKVKVIQDLNILYDTVYGLVTRNNDLLPKEAFYPTAFDSDNTFNRGKLNDINNKDLILNDIKRYFNKKLTSLNSNVNSRNSETAKKLLIYKTIFNHPISVQDNVNVTSEINKIQSFTGDINYLTGDFIADFYNYVLQNKLENTLLYQQVLNNFDVGRNGIYLKNNDPYTKQVINLLSPSNKIMNDLKQYTLISKEESLQDIFKVEPTNKLSDKHTYRMLYMNYPSLLKSFKGDYTLNQDELVTHGSVDTFIKTKEGLFELVNRESGISLYRGIPVVESNNFKDYSTRVNTNDSIDLTKYYNQILVNDGKFSYVEKLYSKKELNTINNKIDECM